MSNRAFFFFVVFSIGLGALIGYELSKLPKLEPVKLLNVVGQSYTLLAVVVLSELIQPPLRWRKASVELAAPIVMWFSSMVPIGVIVGGFVGGVLLKAPSGKAVSALALTFFVWTLLPTSILNATVTLPTIAELKPVDSRWRWFGFYLLVNGVGFQLAAAILDLTS